MKRGGRESCKRVGDDGRTNSRSNRQTAKRTEKKTRLTRPQWAATALRADRARVTAAAAYGAAAAAAAIATGGAAKTTVIAASANRKRGVNTPRAAAQTAWTTVTAGAVLKSWRSCKGEGGPRAGARDECKKRTTEESVRFSPLAKDDVALPFPLLGGVCEVGM